MKRHFVKDLSAIVLLIAGVAMAFIALFLPPSGEIHDSVLYLFAQILIYCGSVLTLSSSIATRQNIQELKELPQKSRAKAKNRAKVKRQAKAKSQGSPVPKVST